MANTRVRDFELICLFISVPLADVTNLVSTRSVYIDAKRPREDDNVEAEPPKKVIKKEVKRDKLTQNFFVTFALSHLWESVRDDILLLIENMCISYLIAKESNEDDEYGHVHIYMKTLDKWKLVDIRAWFVEHLGLENFDIQSVRSPKSTIKYISKEDLKLITNLKVSLLHFNYRVHKWAVRNDEFRFDHHFVVEHRNCYRFLQSYYSQHLDFRVKIETGPLPLYCVADWANEVVEWFNTFVMSKGLKRKQLYLYGPTNTGKSQLIDLILSQYCDRVYYPDVGKFFMNGFRKGFHQVILFEEFNYQYHILDMIKRLIEGRMFSYPRKCVDALSFQFDGPVIFVSNHHLDVNVDPAFISRLNIVFACNNNYVLSSSSSF